MDSAESRNPRFQPLTKSPKVMRTSNWDRKLAHVEESRGMTIKSRRRSSSGCAGARISIASNHAPLGQGGTECPRGSPRRCDDVGLHPSVLVISAGSSSWPKIPRVTRASSTGPPTLVTAAPGRSEPFCLVTSLQYSSAECQPRCHRRPDSHQHCLSRHGSPAASRFRTSAPRLLFPTRLAEGSCPMLYSTLWQ